MNKTIEAAFFKAFSFGGVLYECFEWLEHKYDLGLYFDREAEKKGRKQPSGKWKKYYDEILPQSIKEGTDAFDYTVIEYIDSPLIDEIANNLDECQNAMQRDRYIFSLLKPFKEYSDKFNPLSIEKQNKGEVKGVVGISELERDLAMWESLPPDEALKNVNGEPSGTPKEQVEACKKMIERCKYNIERANYVANRYREILSSDVSLQDGTVEYCMSHLHFYLIRFAYRLDALLLERGINLLWYQNECGIYLFEYRDITTIDFFIGSYQLARKYIDEALPKYPDPKQVDNTETAANKITLPSELNTEPAKALFQGAIQNGLHDNNYKWLKSKALLAYFAERASEYLNLGKGEYVHSSGKAKATLKKTSWKPFETLFGIKGLSGARNDYSNKIEKLPDGYEDVDKLFE